MCGDNSCNVFLLLLMLLWVLVLAMLCRRAVLMLWHAFLFLGLRPVGIFPLCCSFLLFCFHMFFVRSFRNDEYL
jgi:hypothetical protein